MKIVAQYFCNLLIKNNIISSLSYDKASEPNSIPYRILSIEFLLKNKISKQLADLFNFSFMTGVFPSVLKTTEVRKIQN